jgi:tetratricopeptide (TPR) repeat protein
MPVRFWVGLLLPFFLLPVSRADSPALAAHRLGQQALDADKLEQALAHFQTSLKLDPKHTQSHLSIAATYLALERDREAVTHLAEYVRAKPTHFLVRIPFAEVLTRLEDFAGAKLQLEKFLADIQEHPKIADDHLVSCHTKLMELAERQHDEYSERLQRGMGLYRLALKRGEVGDEKAMALCEELLCKSAAELTMAQLQRPEEARPCWYLYLVWYRLGQQSPAMRWLRKAERLAGLSYLTPNERRTLHDCSR